MRDVRYAWPGGFALKLAQFDVLRGESVLLLGESGSGKSTLLSLICGIASPDAGQVTICGTDLGGLGASQRDRFRADRIGVIFQMFNLLPYASGLENILLPLKFAPARRASLADARRDALALAAALGLPEKLLTEGPASSLSVGQQQRIAVARALLGSPDLIVADEPTSALDAAAQHSFLSQLFDQTSASGSAVLMVSHDERLGDRFDRVVRLKDIATVSRGSNGRKGGGV